MEEAAGGEQVEIVGTESKRVGEVALGVGTTAESENACAAAARSTLRAAEFDRGGQVGDRLSGVAEFQAGDTRD